MQRRLKVISREYTSDFERAVNSFFEDHECDIIKTEYMYIKNDNDYSSNYVALIEYNESSYKNTLSDMPLDDLVNRISDPSFLVGLEDID